MPGITLEKAISTFSRELGCGANRDFLIDAIQASLEYALYNGAGEILREWRIPVRNGRFTLPPDMETPIKWKYTTVPDFGYGTVNSSYFSFSSQGVRNCCGFWDWDRDPRIEIKANRTPTYYQPPCGGVRLIATTRDDKDVGKKIVVGGKWRGKQVAPLHNGYKTGGELLTIYAEDDPDKKYGAWMFDEITSVVKEPTCAWVMLSGLAPDCNEFFFLSHYHPDEEVPMYREAELFSCLPGQNCVPKCDFMMHILGRINPSIRYTRDEEILPITSFEILRLLAKRAHYDESGDYNEVAAMETRIKVLIKREVAYQQAAGRHLSFSLKSGGAIMTNM